MPPGAVGAANLWKAEERLMAKEKGLVTIGSAANQLANKRSRNFDDSQMAMYASRLFDFYHTQELSANPETFLTGVIELFSNYPMPIVAKAVSPVFGLPAKFKFPPRIAEIKEFLDGLMPRTVERVYPLLPRDEPVDRAPRLTYEQLKEKYGDNWGLNTFKPKKASPFASAEELQKIAGDNWDKIPNGGKP